MILEIGAKLVPFKSGDENLPYQDI